MSEIIVTNPDAGILKLSAEAQERASGCASATGSATYEDGWRDGLHAAVRIFTVWYDNNCTTAGATNLNELARKLLESAERPDKSPNK